MNRGKTRSHTLQQAASVVFALTAVLPLLIFAWTLHRLNAMSGAQAQLGLGLALAAALLGFYIFRTLMGRMSALIQAVGNATELGARSAADARTSRTVARPDSQSAREPQEEDARVPGIGTVQEVRNLTQAMAALWNTEAMALKGRHVVVSVINSPRPIAGILVEATEDGILLEQNVGVVAVTYRRISAIDVAEAFGETGTT